MLPTIATGNVGSALAGEYEVSNSLRFDDGSSDHLSRTPSSAGNRKTWTWSGWVKRCGFGSQQTLFGTSSGASTFHLWYLSGNDTLTHNYNTTYLETNAKFRDTSAWYHFVCAVDTTQATASDRVKIYVNGSQITSFAFSGYPSQNTDMTINNNVQTDIGNSGVHYTHIFDGYMAEVVFIDGSQLDPTSFGEFDEDTGIWKPIDVSGLTFGTNGFYLDFESSGSLGSDVSGNGNNFTVNNLTSIDQTTDTPTNNYATINSLDNLYIGGTLSEGNTKIVTGVAQEPVYINSTIGVASGKWYCEVKNLTPSGRGLTIGISGRFCSSSNDSLGSDLDGFGYTQTGVYRNNNSTTSYGDSYTQNDIIGIALDLDNNKLYFSKNGTWQNSGDPTSGATGTGAISIGTPSTGFYFIALGDNSGNTTTFETNFGNPAFTISSGNSDGNGMGNFEYPVPSGYFALCTSNLAEHG